MHLLSFFLSLSLSLPFSFCLAFKTVIRVGLSTRGWSLSLFYRTDFKFIVPGSLSFSLDRSMMSNVCFQHSKWWVGMCTRIDLSLGLSIIAYISRACWALATLISYVFRACWGRSASLFL